MSREMSTQLPRSLSYPIRVALALREMMSLRTRSPRRHIALDDRVLGNLIGHTQNVHNYAVSFVISRVAITYRDVEVVGGLGNAFLVFTRTSARALIDVHCVFKCTY